MTRQVVFFLLGVLLVYLPHQVWAQQDVVPNTPEMVIKEVPLVKQGRAPRIEDLVQIRLATPPVQPPRRGAINPLRLPPELEQGSTGLVDGSNNTETIGHDFPLMANAPMVSLSIPGYSSDDNAAVVGGRITPPDTNGDVGITHYVQYINLGWVFFDKATGAVAGGPFAGNIFWAGFGGICETENAGDPIVLYDHIAGRWLFSQFTGTTSPDGHQCIAISDGEDPAGPYTLFDFIVSPGGFNDYPKIGLWPDGYYMTTHEFAGAPLAFQGVNLTVFDRAALLAGTAGGVQFSPTTLEFGSLAANLEGPDLPPAGTCNYLVHGTDGAAFGGTDRYQFWEACLDFNTPANSTLTQLPDIPAPAFDVNLCGFSRDCIFQPSAQRLDPLAAFTVYRFNNRYFPAEGILRGATTNNVDVGGDRAGVLWAGFEINPLTNAIAIGDGGDLLGVVDFADGLSRWAGSASVDASGNIGIGYTRSSSTSFPSIYFTVHERGVDAPGGVQAESVCVDGTGTHEGANRWADYASTSVDPVDGCTFWHTNEYVETTGNFQWNTRVCSFMIPSCVGGFVDLDLVQMIPANINEPGGAITVDITVTNNEAGAIELTGLINNLAGDLNGQGSCAVPQSIAAGADYSCSFSTNISGDAGDVITSVTTASGNQLGTPFSANDSDMLTISDVLPAVAVSKSASPDNVDEPGGNVTFNAQVQNTGTETITLNTLVDDIHGDLNGQGNCSVPQTIAVNASYNCSFTVMVNGNAGDTETDTITASVSDDDGNNAQGQASATVTINDVLPTITVSKSASPDNVDEPGGVVTFSTQVSNTGIETITLTSLVDDIHGDLNGQGNCSVPQTIAANGSYSCSFTANVTGNAGDTETDTITASVSDDDGNNVQGQASATVTINGVAPTITVSKTASPDNVDEPGNSVTFSAQVQNTGAETITLNTLVDDIHGDLNGQGNCSVPQSIAANASYSCSFTVMVNGNAGDTETDTITASASDDDGNNVQGQASATVTINDVLPTVTVSKSALPDNVDEPGGNVTFSAQVQNTGVETITLNTLVDDIHGDLNGQGNCSVPQSIAANASYSCSFTVNVTGNAGDVETDTITASVSDDDGNNAQGQASATVTINDVLPAVTVSKSASPDNVDEPGGNVTFNAQVQNTGAETITLNTLIDNIHGDLNGQGNCSVPQTIAVNASYSCSFTVMVNGNAGDTETDTITASVSDDDGNNAQGQASATVTINDVLPTITVSKSASPDNVDEPGGVVTFSTQVSNTGIETITLTSLVDDIHGDLNGQGNCSVPQTIAANGNYSCSFTANVTGNAGDTETDTITTIASDDDGNNVQGQASATVTINDVLPMITVSKLASPDNVDEPGGAVTFSAQVQNTGAEMITLTSLVDDIHGDLNGQGDCAVPQNIVANSNYACSFVAMVIGVGGDTETDTIIASVSDDDGNNAQGQASATVTINNIDTSLITPLSIDGLEDQMTLLTGISVVDPGAPLVFIRAAVSNGLLTLNGTAGLSFTVGDGVNDSLLEFSGSVAAVNQALNGASYQPNTDFNGSDSLSLQADDETLTRLASATVTLNITPVNDEPTFAAGPNQSVDNDAGPQVISPWATDISAGPADESGQVLSFTVVSVSNPALFSVQPEVAPDGSLRFAPQPGANGVASISVRLNDDGGVDNGGDDQSDEQVFTIEILSAEAADLSISKTNGMGGADENQTFDYTIVVNNAGPTDVVGATVTDSVAVNLSNPNWVCVASAGGSCTASGTGNINDVVNIPAGGSVTYTLTVTVAEPEGGIITNTATVTPPNGLTDPNLGNNSGTDSDSVGLFVDGFESE